MNNDWQKLLAALETGLRDQVMPHVATERARVQLNAVIYVLSNLRLQGAWSEAVEQQHIESREKLFTALEAADSGEGDEAVNALIDRLSAVPVDERDAEYHGQRALLMAHLRESVQIDRAVTARSMMLELSGPGSESVS